jgi:hypothetical protein
MVIFVSVLLKKSWLNRSPGGAAMSGVLNPVIFLSDLAVVVDYHVRVVEERTSPEGSIRPGKACTFFEFPNPHRVAVPP